MSSSFKETFTRDESKPGLGFDDSAFYYFAFVVMLIISISWIFFLIRSFKANKSSPIWICRCENCTEVERKSSKGKFFHKFTFSKIIQIIIIIFLVYLTFYCYQNISEVKEMSVFDPYQILNISKDSNESEIKSAYRRLILLVHPDKNPGDPLAASKFIRINKAYDSLINEESKRNFEKYGNPEGPGPMKV